MNANEILEKITDNDIIDILIELGSDDPIEVNDGYLFTTICHCGDKKKLHYHSKTKTFYCYTNCGNLSSIFNVVMKIKNCKFIESYNYICKFLGISTIRSFKSGFEIGKIDNSFIKKFNIENKEYEQVQIYDDKVLNSFWDLYHEDWINDFISIEVMKLFNIKFDISNYRIIIPHYDLNNNLIGIRCRNLNKELIDKGYKYMPIYVDGILYNYPTSLNLFGLNINKFNIKKYKKVIIGESEKFVMQHRSFTNNSIAVALNGSALSLYQIDLLLELGVETVVLALDKEYENDDEENKYKEKINNSFIKKLINYFSVEIIWDTENLLSNKMSPTDKGPEIFDRLYKQRIIL